MFIYDNGVIVDYDCTADYSPDVARLVKAHMLSWAHDLGGQSRVRLGKVGIMQGATVNLKRMENE